MVSVLRSTLRLDALHEAAEESLSKLNDGARTLNRGLDVACRFSPDWSCRPDDPLLGEISVHVALWDRSAQGHRRHTLKRLRNSTTSSMNWMARPTHRSIAIMRRSA